MNKPYAITGLLVTLLTTVLSVSIARADTFSFAAPASLTLDGVGPITLDRLVQSDTVNEMVQKRLAETTVMRVEHVPSTYFISRHVLDEKMADALNGTGHLWVWRGNDRMQLRVTNTHSSVGAVEELAQKTLENWLSQRSADFEVSLVNAPRIHESVDSTTWKVRAISAKNVKRRMAVWADLVEGSRVIATQVFWFQVSAMQKVIVTAKPLEAREAFTPVNLAYAWVDVASLVDAPIINAADVVGKRSRVAIKRNEALVMQTTETLPAVLANQTIAVKVNQGSLQLVISGIALRDGRMGEMVPVKTSMNRLETINAKVIGKNQVLVTGSSS